MRPQEVPAPGGAQEGGAQDSSLEMSVKNVVNFEVVPPRTTTASPLPPLLCSLAVALIGKPARAFAFAEAAGAADEVRCAEHQEHVAVGRARTAASACAASRTASRAAPARASAAGLSRARSQQPTRTAAARRPRGGRRRPARRRSLPPPRSALRGSRTSGRVDHIDAFRLKGF